MKKYLLLLAVFSLFASAAYAQPWAKMHDEDLMELRLSIGAYLLLDELQLSPAQKSELAAILDDFRREQAGAEAAMRDFHDTVKAEMTAVLEKLKSGKGITEEEYATLAERRDRHFETMKPIKEKLDAHIARILGVLDDNQDEILRKFNPMGKFGAPGQAPALFAFMEEMKEASGAEILDKIRSMSDLEFAQFKENSCPMGGPGGPGGPGMGPDMLCKKGRGHKKDKAPGERLMARFETIRAMSEDEFQAKKEDLGAFIEKGRELRAKRGDGRKGAAPMDGETPPPFMGKAHQHMVRAIILSDGFYEALKSN